MAIAKRKKKFFDVDMPIIKKQTQLLAFDISELEGKWINYDLTRMLRGKGTLLQLKVFVKDDKATSIPTELRVLPYFLKRMTRKGSDYCEDSISTECKDAEITIKPLLVTRKRVSKAVLKALRAKAREEIINELKTKTSEEIFDEILKNKMQKELSLKMKKIYPLSLCEFRVVKINKFLEKKISEKNKEKTESEKEVEEESKKE